MQLGGELARAEAMSGGDLSQVLRITLADGRQAVAKCGPDPRAEAAMLQAISGAGAPAPRVLAVDGATLVLEALRASGRVSSAWASLGAALARLHDTVGERYGWDCGYAFGEVTIENAWNEDWPAFWAEHRLMTHVAYLPPSLARRVERLACDCTNRLPARPKASLLHGDLWGGNVLVADEVVSGLIDPACYFGHGEVDIAMLGLFDHPGPGFFDGYGVLEPGAEERLLIYRLWPVLVHVRLFGASYLGLADQSLLALGF